MAFPGLSRRPAKESYTYVDNTVSYDSEGGYTHRRPRYTRKKRKFEVVYDLLPTADRDLLKAHYEEVGRHTSFVWTDKLGAQYTVYYDKPLKDEREIDGWYRFDSIELLEL